MANEGAGGSYRVQGQGHRCLPERPDGWGLCGSDTRRVEEPGQAPDITLVTPRAKAGAPRCARRRARR